MAHLSTVLLGTATALWIVYKLSSFIWLYFIHSSSLPKYHHGRPGSTWALVTGASDGIGHGFAESLLTSGFNVLLHGRNPKKLAAVRSALATQHPHLEVRTVVADAFTASRTELDSLAATASALPGPLTVLVNNVGGVPVEPVFGAVVESDAQHLDDIINLNARFPAQLTRALLPLLISTSPSLILNLSSGLALRGGPFFAAYSASKAFNYTFSESLKAEMRAFGHGRVEVLGIVVGNVTSGGNRVHVDGITCTSLEMARQALARVGCGRANVWGWYRHALGWFPTLLMPEGVLEGMMVNMLKGRKEKHEKGL